MDDVWNITCCLEQTFGSQLTRWVMKVLRRLVRACWRHYQAPSLSPILADCWMKTSPSRGRGCNGQMRGGDEDAVGSTMPSQWYGSDWCIFHIPRSYRHPPCNILIPHMVTCFLARMDLLISFIFFDIRPLAPSPKTFALAPILLLVFDVKLQKSWLILYMFPEQSWMSWSPELIRWVTPFISSSRRYTKPSYSVAFLHLHDPLESV